MSLLLSAEMEVDGDLKVTGTVESTTIDSLKAVIADLQAQLAELQASGGAISGRIIEIPMEITDNYVDHILILNDITGESQDWYRLSFISAEYSDNGTISMNGNIDISVNGVNHDVDNDFATPSQALQIARMYNGDIELYLGDRAGNTFMISDSNPRLGVRTETFLINQGGMWNGTVTLKFLVESNF